MGFSNIFGKRDGVVVFDRFLGDKSIEEIGYKINRGKYSEVEAEA